MVYNVKDKDIPIVHRVVRSYKPFAAATVGTEYVDCPESIETIANHLKSGTLSAPSPQLLTKGDNNVADDTELYARGQSYLDRKEDIIGSVRGYVPGVGYVTIMLSEHPWLKTVMLGLMGVMVVLQRE